MPGAADDETLVWLEGTGTTDRRWLMTDPRGSVIGIANASGAVTNINRYDTYGTPQAGNVGRFQYTGQMQLAEIGLHYYKARLYHSALGRFLQTDPIGYADGMNLYAYVGNDPVNLTDPTGLAKAACDAYVCSDDKKFPKPSIDIDLASLETGPRYDFNVNAPPEAAGGDGSEQGPQSEKARCDQALVEFGNGLRRAGNAVGAGSGAMAIAGVGAAVIGMPPAVATRGASELPAVSLFTLSGYLGVGSFYLDFTGSFLQATAGSPQGWANVGNSLQNAGFSAVGAIPLGVIAKAASRTVGPTNVAAMAGGIWDGLVIFGPEPTDATCNANGN